jgi:hypothetical protein
MRMSQGPAVARMGTMTRSRTSHRMNDVPFFLMFTLGHAAVAFPTLRLWAEFWARRKHPH